MLKRTKLPGWIGLILVGWVVLSVASPASHASASSPSGLYISDSAVARSVASERDHSDAGKPFQNQRDPRSDKLMLDSSVGVLDVVDDARWSARWTDSSIVALLAWVLLMAALLVAGLPISETVFRSFPDRGRGFSRMLALLIAGYAVWICSSLKIIEFRAVWAGFALLAVGVVAWLMKSAIDRQPLPPSLTATKSFGSEFVFWFVFAVFGIFRLTNPDSWHPIWGGEKPMEFAHMNAILRSAHFPPYDPWFSDGILNYYYYGEYLVAFLFKLSGIPSEIAFNLAQPTVIALLASGTFSVACALSARLTGKPGSSWVAGLAGVVLMVFAGNLVTFWNLIEVLPDQPHFTFVNWTWNASRAISGGITEFPYFTGLYADLHAHVVAMPITVLVAALCFSIASEEPSASGTVNRQALGLFGVRCALLALALGTLSAANAWDVPVYLALTFASLFLAAGVHRSLWRRCFTTASTGAAIAGGGYLLFKPFHDSFVALFNDIGRVRIGTDPGEFALHLGGLMGILLIGVLVGSLFTGTAETQSSGMTVTAIGFGVVVIGLLGLVASSQLDKHPSNDGTVILIAILSGLSVWKVTTQIGINRSLATASTVSWMVAASAISSRGWPVLAIGLSVALTGSLAFFGAREKSVQFVGVLVAAAGFVVAGVERSYVVDDLSTSPDFYRMNTIFKLYNEVWILFALAASCALSLLIFGLKEVLPDPRPDAVTSAEFAAGVSMDGSIPSAVDGERRTVSQVIALAACSTIVLASLAYPLVSTRPRLALRFHGHPSLSTLNAVDWMRYGTLNASDDSTISFSGDKAAIDWFNSEVKGTPVIAEASIGPYRGNGSRISIATGLPSVLGWDRHERQQRYSPEIDQRVRDLSELYNSTSTTRKLELLQKYRVQYLVVGDVERKTSLDPNVFRPYASQIGLATFDAMVGESLEIAFESGATIVYRVVG